MKQFFKITGYIIVGGNIASAWMLAISNNSSGAVISVALAWLVWNEARKIH